MLVNNKIVKYMLNYLICLKVYIIDIIFISKDKLMKEK